MVLAVEAGTAEEARLQYAESDEFNEAWDDLYGKFEMGEYSYPASEILFNVNYKAYETEYNLFAKVEPVVEDGVEA